MIRECLDKFIVMEKDEDKNMNIKRKEETDFSEFRL